MGKVRSNGLNEGDKRFEPMRARCSLNCFYMNSSPARYHGLSRVLHWLLALGLMGTFALGLYMADLPFSMQRLKLYNWHKWAGVVVLTLSLLRLLTRLIRRPPALPLVIEMAMPSWQRTAHHATHLGLYGLFFAVPLVGWAYSSASGFPLVPFGLFQLPDWVPVNESLAEWLQPVHKYLAFAMAALVLLHVAGALKHHFIDRDGLLQRMGVG